MLHLAFIIAIEGDSCRLRDAEMRAYLSIAGCVPAEVVGTAELVPFMASLGERP